jgi:hypothetical protein
MPANFSTTAKAAALASNLNPATGVCSVPMAMYLVPLFKKIPVGILAAAPAPLCPNCGGASWQTHTLSIPRSGASEQE